MLSVHRCFESTQISNFVKIRPVGVG